MKISTKASLVRWLTAASLTAGALTMVSSLARAEDHLLGFGADGQVIAVVYDKGNDSVTLKSCEPWKTIKSVSECVSDPKKDRTITRKSFLVLAKDYQNDDIAQSLLADEIKFETIESYLRVMNHTDPRPAVLEKIKGIEEKLAYANQHGHAALAKTLKAQIEHEKASITAFEASYEKLKQAHLDAKAKNLALLDDWKAFLKALMQEDSTLSMNETKSFYRRVIEGHVYEKAEFYERTAKEMARLLENTAQRYSTVTNYKITKGKCVLDASSYDSGEYFLTFTFWGKVSAIESLRSPKAPFVSLTPETTKLYESFINVTSQGVCGG